MAEGNGSPVTWRELNLLRETINERFDGLEDKIELLVENRKDSNARRLSYFAIFAAFVGDIATIVWLTH